MQDKTQILDTADAKSMTPRQRILAGCAHQTPDRTPMDFGGTLMSECTCEFLAKFRDFLGLELPDDRDEMGTWADEAIQKYLNVDLRFVPFEPPLTLLRDLDPPAYEAKRAGYLGRKQALEQGTRTYIVSHDFPLSDYTYEQVKQLKPNLPEAVPSLEWSIETAKDYRRRGYATTYWVSSGFFELGCWARGYDRFAMDLILNPDLVRALFDLWLEEKLHKIETTVKPLAPYIDIFCFGDDLALQSGPFMSPDDFREKIKPYFDIHYRRVHEAAPQSRIFHHSCGSVYRLLDDLIDMGVDILNPIQPNAVEMEPEKLKSAAGHRLTFHGGIDLQNLLPFGTPDEIRAEVKHRCAVLGRGGGYICAPAHSLPEDVPLENICALFNR